MTLLDVQRELAYAKDQHRTLILCKSMAEAPRTALPSREGSCVSGPRHRCQAKAWAYVRAFSVYERAFSAR